MLCSAMMRAAGLDFYEQGDVCHKVAELRPPPTDLPAHRAAGLSAAMGRLMTIDTSGLCQPGSPLAGHQAWLAAFEDTGRYLGELSEAAS